MLSIAIPARINLVGSPTDAVEGAYATISAAIDVYGGAQVEDGDCIEFRRRHGSAVVFAPGRIERTQGFDLEAAAINGFLRHAPELASRMRERGIKVETWTEVPTSSGLAGSSVLLLAVLTALRAHYQLDPRAYNDYVLAEIAQRTEEQDLGVVCGFADRYVPLLGDVAYLNYHGKLWHAPLGEEPYVTYEKLGAYVEPLQLCVATTGVRRDSGSVHAPMRHRYLSERRHGSGPLLELAQRLGATAWRGKVALLAGDLEAFGEQIDLNQLLIEELMHACGFAAGAGKEVNQLIDAARAAGALGAKLTGAGGGGAVFALPQRGEADRLATALRRAATGFGMQNAEIFVVSTVPHGWRIQ